MPKLLDKKSPIQGASGSNREAESTDAPERGGLLRSSDEAGCPWSEGSGSFAIWLGSTGNGRNRCSMEGGSLCAVARAG